MYNNLFNISNFLPLLVLAVRVGIGLSLELIPQASILCLPLYLRLRHNQLAASLGTIVANVVAVLRQIRFESGIFRLQLTRHVRDQKP